MKEIYVEVSKAKMVLKLKWEGDSRKCIFVLSHPKSSGIQLEYFTFDLSRFLPDY
jgi:hypothetical protein